MKHRRLAAKQKSERMTFDHWSKAFDTALYYGFSFVETPIIGSRDSSAVKGMKDSGTNGNSLSSMFPQPEEKAAILRQYLEKNMQSLAQPVMLFYEGEVSRDMHHFRPTKERIIHLDILGTTRSIAEAMIIQTAHAILKEYGFKNVSLQVNSIGDKDSIARFTRELTAYYRRNIEELPAPCRQALKKSVFAAL